MIRNMLFFVAAMMGLGASAMAQNVMPLDLEGSDEYIHEQGSSGFDTGGAFAIPQDDYDSGDNGDGTWTPDVPDVPAPTPVDDYYYE
ncbi:MAG TPA: hypothetical protein DCW68_05530 [Rhodospirillaceae bacterium]|nr:MAG: hypothetical protein A2018_02125 [Alphaproteobacteria bacterium GWF2_58_20]HAU29556.1 hypothetical protein [Rhodospirillaceae bacterium]